MLKRFDDYWDPEQPKIAGIRFRILPDDETRVAALKTGEIDMTWVATPDVAKSASEGGDIKVVAEGYNKPVQLYLNNQNKALADVRVRRAISLAIDRQEYIELVARGDGAVSTAIPPTDAFWAYPEPETLAYHTPNIDEAKSLLAEAGYAKGLKLRLQTSELVTHVTDSEILKDQLAKVGITADISVLDSAQSSENLDKRNYDLAIAGGRAVADPDAYFFPEFHSSSAKKSRSAYPGDAHLDELLEKGRSTADADERQGIYREVQEVVADLVPQIWLYSLPVRWELVRSSVENYPGIDKFISRSPAMNTVAFSD